MNEEGWYKDPYGAHEERWFSDGTPTSLVRDGTIETRDNPPNREPPRALVPIEAGSGDGAQGLRRADDAERGERQLESTERWQLVADVFTEGTPPA